MIGAVTVEEEVEAEEVDVVVYGPVRVEVVVVEVVVKSGTVNVCEMRTSELELPIQKAF